MSNKDRLPVFPSRASQLQMKNRLANAKKGHSVLRKKSDALQMKYRQIQKSYREIKDASLEVMKKALFSLAEAKFTGVDVGQLIFQDVDQARVKVKVREENIAGVYLCNMDLITKASDTPLVGLGRGGQQLSNVRQQFYIALHVFVKMAQMQSAIKTLQVHIAQLNRRVNSLQYVIMPCIVRTLNYISTEMDEYEREEFYRLKKIQNRRKTSFLNRPNLPQAVLDSKSHHGIASMTGSNYSRSIASGDAGSDKMFGEDEDIIV